MSLSKSLFLFFLMSSVTPASAASTLRINLGSAEPSRLEDGSAWSADRPTRPDEAQAEAVPLQPGQWQTVAAGTVTREPDLPIAPGAYADLLRSEVFGLERIRLRLEPGRYTLRLWVGETFENLDALERRFHLAINGETLPESVHPFKIARGFARAGILEIEPVTVGPDGLLLLEFDGEAFGSNPIANALEVVPLPETVPVRPLGGRRIALAPYEPPPPPEVETTDRFSFFIAGHSGMFHWAIPETLQRMLAFSHPQWEVSIELFKKGGRDVRFFAESAEIDAALGKNFDYFIVMDSSWGPIEHPDVFDEWMPELITKISEAGSTPLLYAYSGPKRHSIAERRQLMKRYADAATTHGAVVLPCAEAFARALEAYPNQNFHNPDEHHIGILTAYLHTAVLYRALTGESAADLPEHTLMGGRVDVPREWVGPLTRIADSVCRDYGVADGILHRE